MTKEEKIKEAWGEYYNNIPKNWLNENGGVYAAFIEREASYLLDCISLDKISALEYRPKSLQGIENNNGWIKIESEYDLPKDGHYWVITKEGILTDSPKSNDLFQDNNYWLSNITHYQPIEKPKPPIY